MTHLKLSLFEPPHKIPNIGGVKIGIAPFPVKKLAKVCARFWRAFDRPVKNILVGMAWRR
jgi:hypothetical protein